jgi:hypothetical protein
MVFKALGIALFAVKLCKAFDASPPLLPIDGHRHDVRQRAAGLSSIAIPDQVLHTINIERGMIERTAATTTRSNSVQQSATSHSRQVLSVPYAEAARPFRAFKRQGRGPAKFFKASSE